MRVLVFSITFRPFIGGAEIALEEIFKRIKGVEPIVITARLDKALPKKEMQNGILVHRVGNGTKLDKYTYVFNAYKLACKIHTEKHVALVQAMMANYAGIVAFRFKKKFPDVPYMLTLQSGDSSFFIWVRTFWFYPLYKKVYTKADYIQSISEYLMTRARNYGYKGKGEIVSNGVDVGFFAHPKSKEEIAAVRMELGIGKEEKVIITTSRLVYKNGIDQLILGFNEWITKSKIPSKLLIIGEGKQEKYLRKIVRKLGIEKKVLFIGQKPYTSLPLYLQASDVFVRPSRSEGMGNSFIEALAAGIPIVGTKVGGIVDFLKHEETGMLIDRDNPYAIARAIHALVQNKQLTDSIVSNGSKMVHERYEWDMIADKMEKILKSLSKV